MTKLYISQGFYPHEYFEATVDFIARIQENDGSIPWFEGAVTDPWDHVEAAMGLTVGRRFDEAQHAYRWLRDLQREDGSWLAAYRDGEVEDGTRAESNFVAYIATGVWHYYLSTRDLDFLESMWDTVERAIDFVVGLQGKSGEIYWALDTTKGVQEDALVTGCCSIYKSLECALNIATTLEKQVPDWTLARTKLANALNNHPESFDRTWESKKRFAMDWFYPVLTGVLTGARAQAQLHSRWDAFVVDDLGCRCVSDRPWVTVAESCELAMALTAAGAHQRATRVFSWLHDYRADDGSYWTGYVFPDNVLWPEERPTWTAGAVLLAADAIANASDASDLFTSVSLIDSAEKSKRSN